MWDLLKVLNNCGCCCCCCCHCCLCLDLRWPQVPWATRQAQRERFQRLSAEGKGTLYEEERRSVPVALWVRQRTQGIASSRTNCIHFPRPSCSFWLIGWFGATLQYASTWVVCLWQFEFEWMGAFAVVNWGEGKVSAGLTAVDFPRVGTSRVSSCYTSGPLPALAA